MFVLMKVYLLFCILFQLFTASGKKKKRHEVLDAGLIVVQMVSFPLIKIDCRLSPFRYFLLLSTNDICKEE